MSEGWIKLYRNLREHWIWEDPVKLRWWIDMLLQANHHDKKLALGNEIILIRRGSFHTSELKLAKRWCTSKKSARTFLNLLQNDGMINMVKSFKGTTIEVSKYGDYQGYNEEKGTALEPHKIDDFQDNNICENNFKDNEVKNRTTKNSSNNNGLEDNFEEEKTIKELCKNHFRTMQELQRNREVYTNNNDKELKECKEGQKGKKTKLPLLLFPTHIHKLIYKEIGDIAYRTWFIDSEITENAGIIEIILKDEFKKGIVEKKYVDRLEGVLRKRVVAKVRE
ncbi:hypothetical protein FDB15_05820 [Clostridium botulinum]|uniref:hypothetical protein n=1 Tax=unclassified Clostridium TaxID=2614128 RepID=UPI00068FB72A|nr:MULTISPECIES: hypothetical protein [unclassified Clostridium]MBY6779798.1 hypothetical protein [Clostridium botulinum]MBY6852994.1 hypothetical protein [Clostridium botulinum]MBY7007391.1 hypothetical protein [Clostridium botulinum]NFH71742.1 hypothetical protein [Clostridium botulinum]NFI00718.1 hypothetical protein [Clostridium botulinum]